MAEVTDAELAFIANGLLEDRETEMAKELLAARRFRAALDLEAWPTETELAVPRFWFRLARHSDERHVELLEKRGT